MGASVGRYKKQIGFLQNYYVCPEDLFDVNCKEMLVHPSQLPAGTSSYPPYLGMVTIDLAVPPAVPFVCFLYQAWVTLPCGE